MTNSFEGIFEARCDVQLLLGPNNQIAVGQHRSKGNGDPCRTSVAGFAGAVSANSPQIGSIVDVEDYSASVRLGDLDRLVLRSRGRWNGEMGAGDQDRARRGDEAFVDVVLAQGTVCAVVPVEDE